MIIKYEDLILTPIKELEKISLFLNIMSKKNDLSEMYSEYLLKN